MRAACSHDYRDVRFTGQLVYDWPVSPCIPLDPAESDGRPRRHMQYGQGYRCRNCGNEVYPTAPATGIPAEPLPQPSGGPLVPGIEF